MITQKFIQNRQTVVMVISIELQCCLKRDRDIGRKAVLSDVKKALTCTPALNKNPRRNERNRNMALPDRQVTFLDISRISRPRKFHEITHFTQCLFIRFAQSVKECTDAVWISLPNSIEKRSCIFAIYLYEIRKEGQKQDNKIYVYQLFI